MTTTTHRRLVTIFGSILAAIIVGLDGSGRGDR